MLSPSERQALKARAHKLEPVVIVGAKGLTEEVVKEIDRALTVHELIKVRAPSLDRNARQAALDEMVSRTASQLVQQVGKVIVLYRKNDESG